MQNNTEGRVHQVEPQKWHQSEILKKIPSRYAKSNDEAQRK